MNGLSLRPTMRTWYQPKSQEEFKEYQQARAEIKGCLLVNKEGVNHQKIFTFLHERGVDIPLAKFGLTFNQLLFHCQDFVQFRRFLPEYDRFSRKIFLFLDRRCIDENQRHLLELVQGQMTDKRRTGGLPRPTLRNTAPVPPHAVLDCPAPCLLEGIQFYNRGGRGRGRGGSIRPRFVPPRLAIPADPNHSGHTNNGRGSFLSIRNPLPLFSSKPNDRGQQLDNALRMHAEEFNRVSREPPPYRPTAPPPEAVSSSEYGSSDSSPETEREPKPKPTPKQEPGEGVVVTMPVVDTVLHLRPDLTKLQGPEPKPRGTGHPPNLHEVIAGNLPIDTFTLVTLIPPRPRLRGYGSIPIGQALPPSEPATNSEEGVPREPPMIISGYPLTGSTQIPLGYINPLEKYPSEVELRAYMGQQVGSKELQTDDDKDKLIPITIVGFNESDPFSEFYVKLKVKDSVAECGHLGVQKIEQMMEIFYKYLVARNDRNNVVGKHNIMLHGMYGGLDRTSNKWRRVQVLHVAGDDEEKPVTVVLIDHGTVLKVDYCDLRFLKPFHLTGVIRQTFQATFSSIPHEPKMNNLAGNMFIRMSLGKQFLGFITSLEIQDNVPLLKIRFVMSM